MKKRIGILALTAVVGASIALAACSDSLDFEDSFVANTASPYATSVSKMQLDGFVFSDVYGGVLVLTNPNAIAGEVSTKYVNIDTNKTIATSKVAESGDTESGKVGEIAGKYSYVLITKTSGATSASTYTLYDLNGNVLATTDDADSCEFGGTLLKVFNDKLVVFGNKVYRQDDENGLVYAFDYDKHRGIPSAQEMGEYAYTITDEVSFVYDLEYNLLSQAITPSMDIEYSKGILNNGNFFIQYGLCLPMESEDYDLYDGYDKIDVVTQIVDAEDGDFNDVDCDFIILNESSVTSLKNAVVDEAFNETFTDDVDNTALIVPIENFRCDTSNQMKRQFVALDNDLDIDGRLDTYVAGQEAAAPKASKIAGVFTAKLHNGETAWLDAEGEVISYFASGFTANGYTSQFFVTSDFKIMNAKQEVLLDLTKEGYTLTTYGKHSIVIAKEGKSYRFFDGGLHEIPLATEETLDLSEYDNGIYRINKADGSVEYYNERGEKIGTAPTNAFAALVQRENVMLFLSDNDIYRVVWG